jgi:myo-inositol-1-phosphate synthase
MMKDKAIGVWLIGALGSVSTAVIAGALAVGQGLVDATGMSTCTQPFDGIGLPALGAIEFGGCDIRHGSLRDNALEMIRETRIGNPDLWRGIEDRLDATQEQIVIGSTRNCGEAITGLVSDCTRSSKTLRDEIAEVVGHLERFKTARGLEDVVVVNLASTEPPIEFGEVHRSLSALETCLDRNQDRYVRASTIYAYAAISSGHPYINFTPSGGALFPAMVDFAEQMGVPVMGNDGKTGETLVKSAIAPMFSCRNLEVLSWAGFNILGNMDGRVLDHPENRRSKITSKDGGLSQILGYKPDSLVNISYVTSLGDQKIAWDYVHFRGFLGAKMSVQFIWEGYDSILAAPIVLDLVRLAVLAKNRREAGLMPHLACFFKAPIGVSEHRLYKQFETLMAYIDGARTDSA